MEWREGENRPRDAAGSADASHGEDTPSLQITGVVLAGGLSRRLHQDKTRFVLPEEFGKSAGMTLLELSVERLSRLCDEVVVVGGGRDRERVPAKARVVEDPFPGKGALGGLYGGLVAARCPYTLTIACDMPFLSLPLLRFMASLARDFDVLVPRAGRQLEPLHAMYSRACIPHIERVLAEDGLRIVRFFPTVRVRYLEEPEWRPFDPQGLSFFNINTPEDLQQALALTRSSGFGSAAAETA